jgi:hypothetical protein
MASMLGHMGPMTQERSRALGRAIMAAAAIQMLLYLLGATRRSYLAVAIPLGIALGAVSGLAFWVGYTMATTDWDHPADYPPEDDPPEGAPGSRFP